MRDRAALHDRQARDAAATGLGLAAYWKLAAFPWLIPELVAVLVLSYATVASYLTYRAVRRDARKGP